MEDYVLKADALIQQLNCFESSFCFHIHQHFNTKLPDAISGDGGFPDVKAECLASNPGGWNQGYQVAFYLKGYPKPDLHFKLYGMGNHNLKKELWSLAAVCFRQDLKKKLPPSSLDSANCEYIVSQGGHCNTPEQDLCELYNNC